jgi:hypothetical protein
MAAMIFFMRNSWRQARLQALPLSELEALADALLDVRGPDDLEAWLQSQEA